MKYYVITGEISGDLHGRKLIDALRRADPEAEIRFWDSSKQVSVMGLVEVARHLGRIGSIFSRCSRDLLEFGPDVLILIDYPGFNLRMAEFAHKRGIRTFYYIAPKLWARGQRRIRKLRKWVDELFVIFPFETDYFTRLGITPHYCGNPLKDYVASTAFEPVLGGGKTIALLAGSRVHEIDWLMPRYVELERILRKDSRWNDYKLVVAAAPGRKLTDYTRHIPSGSSLQVVQGQTYSLLKQADAALVCSGTASLETAIIGTPQVVCYGFNCLTYILAINLLRSRYISLANLILDKWIFRELVQKEASPRAMALELEHLVFDPRYRQRMKDDYDELSRRLGGSGVSDRLASEMVNILKNKS